MTNFIPIFPLNIVAFPNEKLNLHIFEPRYKQLIRVCFEEEKVFGIPTVLNNSIKEFGTTFKIQKIEKEYPNGELDIKTEGINVFKILEIIKQVPNKLYSGAIVNYPENKMDSPNDIKQKVLENLMHFYQLIHLDKKYNQDKIILNSYDVAHHVGFTLEQEYEFLSLLSEHFRLQYLSQHIDKMLLTIEQLNILKERVKLNGHFKKLSIDNLD